MRLPAPQAPEDLTDDKALPYNQASVQGEGSLAERKANRAKSGATQATGRKEPAANLIPANPLSAREALIQVALLIGIPLILLLLARILLHQFLPSLGY
ncbi:MAG: hypothetical protein DMH00_05030 [Acidobacteria bacterium]|nr:MAG: hypothetical protein DMH00_05030 [Acidobacteriota bacterium]